MRRVAGVLAVLVMTATPMVVSACVALCAPDVRRACHEPAVTLDGTAAAPVAAASAGERSSTKTPLVDTRHQCCAHAQAAVSAVPPSLPVGTDHVFALLPVGAVHGLVERPIQPLVASPPRSLPPDPLTLPLVLRV